MTGHRAEQAAGLVSQDAAEPDGEAGQGSKSQPDARTLQDIFLKLKEENS